MRGRRVARGSEVVERSVREAGKRARGEERIVDTFVWRRSTDRIWDDVATKRPRPENRVHAEFHISLHDRAGRSLAPAGEGGEIHHAIIVPAVAPRRGAMAKLDSSLCPIYSDQSINRMEEVWPMD